MPEEKQPNGKNSQKTIAIVLYILIAVIVIAVGVYWWMTKDEATTTITTNNTTNTTVEDTDYDTKTLEAADYDYTDWQDYEYINNEKTLNEAIKYPEDWFKTYEDNKNGLYVAFSSEENAGSFLEMEKSGSTYVLVNDVIFTGTDADGEVVNNPDYYSVLFDAEVRADLSEIEGLNENITKIADVQINGRTAVIFERAGIPDSDSAPNYNYVIRDGGAYTKITFMNNSVSGVANFDKYQSLFDQMAASFVVSDYYTEGMGNDATADWTTFTSDQYDYQISYPDNVEIKDDLDGMCVFFQYKENNVIIGDVTISTPDNYQFEKANCGRTGYGYDIEPITANLTIDGKSYTANGYEEKGPGETLEFHNETLVVNLDDKTRIEFGAAGDDSFTYADYLEIKPDLIKMVESYQAI
ncbi:MAG: hypothetical protein ACD_68C00043G0002 [uncultured bacterium]|nr:MAG: hypothetical protein ACD_68C00043G0002 [uncultured bacterium]